MEGCIIAANLCLVGDKMGNVFNYLKNISMMYTKNCWYSCY